MDDGQCYSSGWEKERERERERERESVCVCVCEREVKRLKMSCFSSTHSLVSIVDGQIESVVTISVSDGHVRLVLQ